MTQATEAQAPFDVAAEIILVCRVCKCPTPIGRTCWCSQQCEDMERAGVEMPHAEQIARRLLRCYGLDRERAGGVAAVAEVAAALAEIETLREECRDRNHVGLDRVLSGVRLPDGSLGQDAAFVAHVIATLERERDDLRSKLSACQTDLQNAVTTACEDVSKLERERDAALADRDYFQRQLNDLMAVMGGAS